MTFLTFAFPSGNRHDGSLASSVLVVVVLSTLASSTLAADWKSHSPGGDTICAKGGEFTFFYHEGYGENKTKLVVEFEGGGACWNDITVRRMKPLSRHPSSTSTHSMLLAPFSAYPLLLPHLAVRRRPNVYAIDRQRVAARGAECTQFWHPRSRCRSSELRSQSISRLVPRVHTILHRCVRVCKVVPSTLLLKLTTPLHVVPALSSSPYLAKQTGDVHVGNKTTTYLGTEIHHRGSVNRLAVMDWVTSHPKASTATEIGVTGCSAGSLGQLLNMPFVFDRFPDVTNQVAFGDSFIGVIGCVCRVSILSLSLSLSLSVYSRFPSLC